MNHEEQELKELVNDIKSEEVIKSLPYYETFVTLISLSIAVLLFLSPNLMINSNGHMYDWLLKLMPQYMWAFSFFGAGILKSIGLVLDNRLLRYIGLIMSTLIYLAFTVCFSINFPSISAIVYAWIAVYSAVSLDSVKHTALDIKRSEDK